MEHVSLQDLSEKQTEPQSLALRLVALAATGSLLALILAGFVMATLQRAGAERAFDERLTVFVTQLFADYANDDVTDATAHFANPAFALPGSGWYWSIADPQTGDPFLASASLFDPLPPPPPLLEGENAPRSGSRNVEINAQRLRLLDRVYVFQDKQVLLRVAAPTGGLDQELRGFQVALAITLGVMWVALLALAFAQVRIGLLPLKKVQEAVADVRTAKTSSVSGRFPQEVSPLVDELNDLLKANEVIVDRARHNVGNLAHALKTPLAVIQNAAQQSASAADLDQILTQARSIDERIRLYLDRAQRAATRSSAGQSTALADVIKPLVRTMAKLNRAQGLAFDVTIDQGLRVKADQQDLEEMFGNLLENACRYASSTVTVSAIALPAKSTLQPMHQISVEDDGDGLSEAARAHVMQRGRRLDEQQAGSGLGLSIVNEMAELYEGAFVLERSSLGGLRAVISLPAAAPVPPDSSS